MSGKSELFISSSCSPRKTKEPAPEQRGSKNNLIRPSKAHLNFRHSARWLGNRSADGHMPDRWPGAELTNVDIRAPLAKTEVRPGSSDQVIYIEWTEW